MHDLAPLALIWAIYGTCFASFDLTGLVAWQSVRASALSWYGWLVVVAVDVDHVKTCMFTAQVYFLTV
jgi:hypothetical protein